jgi:hypothetical protein
MKVMLSILTLLVSFSVMGHPGCSNPDHSLDMYARAYFYPNPCNRRWTSGPSRKFLVGGELPLSKWSKLLVKPSHHPAAVTSKRF